MRLGMLLYKFLHSLGVIEAQQSTTRSHNSNIPLGGLSYRFSRRLKVAHKCSIGFKSRDCASHFKTINSCKFSQWHTLLDVCFGSLSCWKVKLARSKLYACSVWINSHSKILYSCTGPFFPQSYTTYQGHSESCNPTSSLPHLQTWQFVAPFQHFYSVHHETTPTATIRAISVDFCFIGEYYTIPTIINKELLVLSLTGKMN
jgi:hypothetical protein